VPALITGARDLDLHDVGAVVGEHQRAVRARERAREIDDTDAIERATFAAGHCGQELERIAVAENDVAFDLLAVDDERGRLGRWDPKRSDDLLRGSARCGDLASLRAELLQLAMQKDADQPAVTEGQSTVGR
jgi:hypothetical protein